jgi:hypothetical protein
MFTPAWCFSTWWYATRPTIVSLLQSGLYFAFTYWEFLFIWISFTTVCSALSRLQHLLQVHSRFPALQHGPLALLSGYGLLWWLTQYNLLLQSVHIPEFWWFFTLQLVPVYCRLLRGTYEALAFWSEYLLLTLMVPCRHSPPMTHICGYGSWSIPPRRRCRRGESQIRIPPLCQSPYISSISEGVSMCVGFALQGWLRAFQCCINRFSAVLQELATI